jgi:cyanophycinase-like exopeptidase
VSNFKDSTDQKACLLEIISNQMERGYWSKELYDSHNESRTRVLQEVVSALSLRIQNQRKELGIDEQGW